MLDIQDYLDRLHERVAARMPDNPMLSGFKAFSQNDEDGIIADILARLPERNHRFVEIGCGNGGQNNTHLLLLSDHRGVWVDGAEANIQNIHQHLGHKLIQSSNRLRVWQQIVDRDTAAGLAADSADFLGTDAPDFLSLDIDGNDAHVLDALLNTLRPKVIAVEYNAKFPPPMVKSIAYNANHVWERGDFFGASLQFFIESLPDYLLVACSAAGTNAFFVRRTYASGFTQYPPTWLFQPPRYELRKLPSGHAGSFKWLKQALRGADPVPPTRTGPL